MQSPMQRTIRHILYFNGLAEHFDTAGDFHLRLENDPWLPLVIERHGDEVSVTHYVIQNGDALRDPEMVFSISDWAHLSTNFQGWVPKSTEPGGFGRAYPTAALVSGRVVGWYPARMKEAFAFARMWAKNLREQGFVKRYTLERISSITHAVALAELGQAQPVPIPIRHRVSPCTEGEIHHYNFPSDLPHQLRHSAYAQAEARLKAEWPDWQTYGYGISSEGLALTLIPLPPCTCGG